MCCVGVYVFVCVLCVCVNSQLYIYLKPCTVTRVITGNGWCKWHLIAVA